MSGLTTTYKRRATPFWNHKEYGQKSIQTSEDIDVDLLNNFDIYANL
ncbi:hypothetical protein ACM26V_09030 [Salipaludibacillus sp. HK11]